MATARDLIRDAEALLPSSGTAYYADSDVLLDVIARTLLALAKTLGADQEPPAAPGLDEAAEQLASAGLLTDVRTTREVWADLTSDDKTPSPGATGEGQ